MNNVRRKREYEIPSDVQSTLKEMTTIPLDKIEEFLSDISLMDKESLMKVFNLTFGEGANKPEPEDDSNFIPEKPVEIPKPSMSSDIPDDVKAILKQCENCGCNGNGICGMYDCKIEYAMLLCLKNDVEEKEKEIVELIKNKE